MELKPGYKQTEVGVIPEDWEIRKCSDLSERIMVGIVIRPSQYYTRDGVPALRSANIREDGINDIDLVFISEESNQLLAKSKVREGDVLTVRTGYPGTSAVAESKHSGSNCIDILITRPSDQVDPRWLCLWINSPFGKEQVLRNQGGLAQKHFNVGDMRNLVVALPKIAEQRTISTAIRDVDVLIRSIEELIDKKRGIKQAAMQELLTGKRRLPGFEGEWEVKRLRDLCSMKSGEGITAKSIDAVSRFPCYGGNGQRGFTSRFTHEGDYCLIGRVGALCGNLLKVSGQFFASEHAIVVSAFENVDIDWLTLALGTLNLNRRAESSAQPVLTVSKLLPLELKVPPTKREQVTIAAVLSDMDAELAALEARRDKARELKQGMMQQLLTGKIRLI